MAKRKRKAEPRDLLTIKRRKFLEVYIETGNATEAAFQAFNCKDRKSAQALGSELLCKLIDSNTISDRMDAAGLTDELLFAKLHEGLDAEKVEVAKHQGSIMDEKSFVDYPTRKSYIDTTLKLKGRLKEHVVHEGAIPVEFTGDNAEQYIKSKLDV